MKEYKSDSSISGSLSAGGLRRWGYRGFTLVMVLCLLATPVAGAENLSRPDYSSENVDNVYIYEDRMTVADHNRSEMSSLLGYYDDNGNAQTVPATLNDSIENPAVVRYDKIDDEAYHKFPRSLSDTALNASDWTTGGQNASKISVSQTDGATATGVKSIQVSASSMASGDSAYVEYTDVSITSDASKRVPLIGVNVDTLKSGAVSNITFIDGDGDEKRFHVGSSFNASNSDVVADATGNGYMSQERFNNLATEGTGDGSFDSIQTVRITVQDADATLTLFALDSERKDTLNLGQQRYDSDGDGEMDDTRTITDVETAGEVKLTGLDGMGSQFDDANVHDLGVRGVEWRASELAAEDVQYDVGDAEAYGGYPKSLDSYERLTVVTAIDLTHSGLELRMDQALVEDRYKQLRMVEGAGETEFSNLSSWSDVSGKLQSEGDTITLDSTIQPGDTYVVNSFTVHSNDEMDDIRPDTTTEQAGSGGFWGGSGGSGGLINWFLAGIAGVVTTATVAIKKLGSSGGM